MCIAIIQKRKSKQLTKKTLLNCYINNGDGIGYAFVKEGKFEVKKFYSSKGKFFDAFYQNYKQDFKEYGKTQNFLLHFRLASHGQKNVSQCHPFKVNDNLLMIHNGIISGINRSNPNKSDTFYFAKKLNQLSNKFLNNAFIKELITDYVGSFNKLCFLSLDNKISIINAKQGHWKDSIWYSNYSYLSYVSKPSKVVKRSALPAFSDDNITSGNDYYWNAYGNGRTSQYDYLNADFENANKSIICEG